MPSASARVWAFVSNGTSCRSTSRGSSRAGTSWTSSRQTSPAFRIGSAREARSRRRSSSNSGRSVIRAVDRSQYRTIADFVGKKVGAVKGMAAERDLLRRAPPGVQIVSTTTFPELYEQFGLGQLDAVAEAEYFTLDGHVIPSYGPEIALIDHHDLNPGQREESVFVVRDKSVGLLDAVNAFVARTPFPLHVAR